MAVDGVDGLPSKHAQALLLLTTQTSLRPAAALPEIYILRVIFRLDTDVSDRY